MAQVVEQLAEDDARVLAGGQSLIPVLNFRMGRPATLVDISRVDELAQLCEQNGGLVIGAGARQRTVEQSALVEQLCPLMTQALRHVGHLQTRAMGTVVGSMAHADPAAELPAVAVALGAELTAVSTEGERAIEASDFFQGPYMTSLRPTEIVTAVRFPAPRWHATALLEIARRPGDFALAGVAVAVRFAIQRGDRRVADSRIVGFGHRRPTVLVSVQDLLSGRVLEDEVIQAAGSAAANDWVPAADDSRENTYRRRAVATLIQRALKEVRGDVA